MCFNLYCCGVKWMDSICFVVFHCLLLRFERMLISACLTFGFWLCVGLLRSMNDACAVIYHGCFKVPHFNTSLDIFHNRISRTPKELQQAMINNAPWSRCKHHRFDSQFRSLVFELLCVQPSLAIPLDDMESIQLAWSMVRKCMMVMD